MNNLKYMPWSIQTDNFHSENIKFYESIFSQANGYMGSRFQLNELCSKKSYEHGIYLAGMFDYIKPGIADIVNSPDYGMFSVCINGEKVRESTHVSECTICMDMKKAEVKYSYIWTANEDKVRITVSKLLSKEDVHVAAYRYEIESLNRDVDVKLIFGIDGDVANNPIEDDQMKESKDIISMLRFIQNKRIDEKLIIEYSTVPSDKRIVEGFTVKAEQIKADNEGEVEELLRDVYLSEKLIAFNYSGKIRKGAKYIFNKNVIVYTSRESSKSYEDCLKKLTEYEGKTWEEIYKNNSRLWAAIWDKADIQVIGNEKDQAAIRYNVFQLIQTNFEEDETVSIGARGIVHNRYKGCFFWDTDIFMLPLFDAVRPGAARNLVKYRYHTLSDAKENAKAVSLSGARYPWMCSIDGKEQCESWDIGKSEVHITADVVYSLQRYVDITGDMDFYKYNAVEIYIETSRYWVSRLTYQKGTDEYMLLFVKGPDEYCGITSNNLYTNWLIRHNLKLALTGIEYLKEKEPELYDNLKNRLGIQESECEVWEEIYSKIKINYDEEQDKYLQDDTLHLLEPLSLEMLKDDDEPLYKKLCFDRLQRYRVLKQPDVILLMTLFPNDFTLHQKLQAWEDFEPITVHDSTLSFGVHAQIGAALEKNDKALVYLEKSLYLDLEDVMKNTGKEGLHHGAFGTAWQALIYGFAGVSIADNILVCRPNLCGRWRGMHFKHYYQGDWYKIDIEEAKQPKKNEKFSVNIEKCIDKNV